MALPTSGIRLEAENANQFFAVLAKGENALVAFGRASTQTSTEIQKLAKTSKEITLDRLNRQLDDQRTRLGIAAQKLGELTNKYGAASVQVQAHEASMKKLAGQMGETQDRILLTERQIVAEAAAAQEATTNNANLESAMRKLAVQAGETGSKVDGMSQIVIGGLRKIGEVGVESLGSLLKSMKDFGVNSVKTAGDFESSLNRFASVTDSAMKSAGLDIGDAKEMFLDLGASTQFSASQVSQAANELAKGGVDIKEVMGEATKATLDLAASGEIDLVKSGEIVAKQLGVWGDEAGGATNAVNLLAQSANASTVNVDDLAIGLANAGGVAKGAGLNFEDTVTAIGLIAPGFSSASDAGTSFKAFLNQLNPTTNAAKDAMRELGLFTDETGSAFYDANGAFIGMEQAAGLLADATKDLTAEQKSLALEVIFGSDAQRAALGLATEGAEGWRNFAAEMTATGTAAEQAAKRNQGFNFAMESLGGAVETLMIRIGDKLLPVLTRFIENGLIPAANWLSDHVGPAIDDFANGLGTVIDGAKVVANFLDDKFVPILVTLGATLVPLAATTIPSLTLGIGGLGTAITGAVSSAMLAAAPFVAFAGALVLVYEAANKYAEIQERIATGTDDILQSRQWFTDASKAVDQFAASSGGASEETKRLAAEVTAQQAAFDKELETFVAVTAERDLGAEFEQKWMDQINAQIPVLEAKTSALNKSMSADRENNQQIGQSQAGLRALREGTSEAADGFNQLTGSIEPSKEQLAAFAKSAEDARTAGLGVFGEMEGSFEGHVSTMAVLQEQYNNARTEAEREGIRQQMNEQLIGYAAIEQAQRESLGRQLIELAKVEGEKAGLSREKINEMTEALRTEYGIRQTIEEQAWGASSSTITEWATTGGQNIDGFIGKLNQTTTSALETQRSLAEMEGTYEFFLKENLGTEVIPDQETFLALMREVPTEQTIHLFQNFMDGTIDAQEFLRQVNAIPSSKTVNIHTSYTSSGTPPPVKGGAEARAEGGPVQAGKPYRVAEEGWELFASKNLFGILGATGEGFFQPTESGRIYSHSDSLAMLRNGTLAPADRSIMPIGRGATLPSLDQSSASGINIGSLADGMPSAAQRAIDMVPWSMRIADLTKRATEGSIRGAFDIFKKETKDGFTSLWDDVLGKLKSKTSGFALELGDILQSPIDRAMGGFQQAMAGSRFQPGIDEILGKIRGETGIGSTQSALDGFFGGNNNEAFGNALNSLASQIGGGGSPASGFQSMPYTPPPTPSQLLGGLQFPQSSPVTQHFNLTTMTAPDPRQAVPMSFRLMQVWGG